jgi:hypothetical protein
MKKYAASLLVLTIIALPGFLSAQSRMVIKADVPFQYVVNGKTMPAGECTIKVTGDGHTILAIESGNEHLFALPNAAESFQPSAETSLVFHKYGDRYFLASINRAGEQRGYELPAGALEKELRAQNNVESDVTLLAYAK